MSVETEPPTPFRDPIIYPGSPMQFRPGAWIRSSKWMPCAIGGEDMEPGTIVRFRGAAGHGWECREHAHPEWGADTP